MKLKNIIKDLIPPVVWKGMKFMRSPRPEVRVTKFAQPSSQQDLDLYWDPGMAETLEHWGEKSAWREIEYLLVNCSGKVLDVACGTGKNIELLSRFPHLEVHGCDISDFLIQRAIDRGIPAHRLTVCDATRMEYTDGAFDYAYSIGSLEHFTEDGISAFVAENHRVARYASFHMLPVSRSGQNEGWMKTVQSFHNNSVEWWLGKFKSSYRLVYVFDSAWEDEISLGKWFVCVKEIRS
jgi:ubiquinone/menaquinone biosynthesis C-methylase UbiE